jgi:hypothetical protein
MANTLALLFAECSSAERSSRVLLYYRLSFFVVKMPS